MSKIDSLSKTVESNPKKVLKSLDFIETALDLDNPFIQALACYTLYQLSSQGYRNEVMKITPNVVKLFTSINPGEVEGWTMKVKCPRCLKTNAIENAIFPRIIKCKKCGTNGYTSGNPIEEGAMDLTIIFWSTSFIYEMARYGNPMDVVPALKDLKKLKDHDNTLIRKRSKLARKHVKKRME